MPVEQRRVFVIVCFCFLLSGFAALLYETVWLRQFAIILGTSEQALAVVLGSYMGGLSFGAWIASRMAGRIRRPLLTYGLLEAGIAGCALAMPLGLSAVGWLQIQIFGGSPQPPSAGSLSMVSFGLLAAFGLILPPTAMMGATLPLLAKYAVHHDRQLGPRIGFLYAVNTLGAVGGTLCAAFVCLPALGLERTIWVGAAVNLSVFALVWIGFKEQPIDAMGHDLSAENQARDPRTLSASTQESSSKASDLKGGPIPYEAILWFAAVSGAVSFCYEIVFTRMLGHMMGGSVFAFATMLAGFLLGIALGGAIAARAALRRYGAATYFVYAQALTGIFALAAFWSINAVSSYSLDTLGGANTTRAQVVLSILILLPSATCIGATFPLAIRVFARDERDAARGSAKVYFWNTIGAIAGSLLTGMFLLPHLAYHGATILAIVLNACLAISLVMVMRLPKAHALAGVATLVVLLLGIPTAPENVLRVSALPGPMIQGDFFFNQVGRSATVTVFNQDGDFLFVTNGLPEALTSRRGAGVPFTDDGAWLGALPTLVRPGCESMLIVGLGGGTAASFVPPSVNQIDVFELEPAVVKANESIRDLRRLDPLADSRVNIVLNDGRNGLLLTRKRYDAIVSQPSHPWTAGASHLYTREFDQIARDHLLPGGIFLQWMGAEFVDAELLRSMAASLLDVFPHVRLYEPTHRSLMFVASDRPIEPEKIEEPKLKVVPSDERFYRAFGMVKPTDLLALLKMDEAALREFAGKSRPITDEFNALAMRAPQLLARAEEEQLEFETSLGAWEPLAYYAARLTEICPTVNYRALGIRIRARTTQASPQILELATDPSERALLESTLAKFAGDTASWAGKLQQAVQIDPNDPRPAFLILAWGELGALPSVDEKTKATLISRLDDRYGNLYKAVVALRNDDLATLRQQEELLASFEPDDIGYEHAMRMRIIWRLGDTGVDRARFGDEALVIAREASPSLGAESVALLETAAAVQANRPYAALATVMTLAKSAIKRVKQFDRGEITIEQVQAFLPVLARCRGLLGDASAFRSVPTQQYRHALRLIDYLLNTYLPGSAR